MERKCHSLCETISLVGQLYLAFNEEKFTWKNGSATRGTQFPPSEQPPETCPICLDERQYVGYNGQQWTTLTKLQKDGFERIKEHEPGLIGIGTTPSFAIGERALFKVLMAIFYGME